MEERHAFDGRPAQVAREAAGRTMAGSNGAASTERSPSARGPISARPRAHAITDCRASRSATEDRRALTRDPAPVQASPAGMVGQRQFGSRAGQAQGLAAV